MEDKMYNLNRGDIMKHFKREVLSEDELKTNKYLYVIRDIAIHTETRETLVVYQALYDDFMTFARPIEMFCSHVDKEKYPNIKQKYRFERY